MKEQENHLFIPRVERTCCTIAIIASIRSSSNCCVVVRWATFRLGAKTRAFVLVDCHVPYSFGRSCVLVLVVVIGIVAPLPKVYAVHG